MKKWYKSSSSLITANENNVYVLCRHICVAYAHVYQWFSEASLMFYFQNLIFLFVFVLFCFFCFVLFFFFCTALPPRWPLPQGNKTKHCFTVKSQYLSLIKEPVWFFLFFFFSIFWRFWYHKKAHIYFITHVKAHSWKVFRLQDINENIPGYGNHIYNYTFTVRYWQPGADLGMGRSSLPPFDS